MYYWNVLKPCTTFYGLIKTTYKSDKRGQGPGLPPYRLVSLHFLLETVIKTMYDSWTSSNIYIYRERIYISPPCPGIHYSTNGVNPNNNPVLTFLQETWRSLHEIMGSNLTFTYKTSSSSTTLKYIKEHFIGLDGVLGIVYLGYGFDRDKLMFFEQLKKKNILS